MPHIELPRRLFTIAHDMAAQNFPDHEGQDHPALDFYPFAVWKSLRECLDHAATGTGEVVRVLLSHEEAEAWRDAWEVSGEDNENVTDADFEAIEVAFNPDFGSQPGSVVFMASRSEG